MKTTPTLIVDETQTKNNIAYMEKKAKINLVRFRPHFKTHQSNVIGRWFREAGVQSITVSSVKMAQYFSKDGWDDILIAFPVNIFEIKLISQLAEKIKLQILIDHKDVLPVLTSALTSSVGVWIKIDVGYHRSGIEWDHVEEINDLVHRILDCKKLEFKGILTHAGNSYSAKSISEIQNIFNISRDRMQHVKQCIQSKFNINVEVSVGDTPGCKITDNFLGIDEIRPGNFAFYDLQQFYLGVSSLSEISVYLTCPVVGIFPQRNEVVIYGGAIHFSKDIVALPEGYSTYGLVKNLEIGNTKINTTGYIRSLSQEHGVVRFLTEEFPPINIGDRVNIYPIHSCLTLQAMQFLYTENGKRVDTMLSTHY